LIKHKKKPGNNTPAIFINAQQKPKKNGKEGEQMREARKRTFCVKRANTQERLLQPI